MSVKTPNRKLNETRNFLFIFTIFFPCVNFTIYVNLESDKRETFFFIHGWFCYHFHVHSIHIWFLSTIQKFISILIMLCFFSCLKIWFREHKSQNSYFHFHIYVVSCAYIWLSKCVLQKSIKKTKSGTEVVLALSKRFWAFGCL